MRARQYDLRDLLDAEAPLASVRVTSVQGSTPREAGALMLVSADQVRGTIGGGQLEYMAIDAARALIRRGGEAERMDIPLGPEIGQCCGGRVVLELTRLDADARAAIRAEDEAARAGWPAVYLFGAGHVGRALAAALLPLPVRAVLVDTREDELALAHADVDTRLTPLPEQIVREAQPGSAFVVLTHDHALDFLIAREALARGDAAYVGLIGSKTKRALFERFCAEENVDTRALVCPIGARESGDKRPAVIAAIVAAEIIGTLTAPPSATMQTPKARESEETSCTHPLTTGSS